MRGVGSGPDLPATPAYTGPAPRASPCRRRALATPFPTDGPCTACERWGRTPLIEGLCAPCGLARGDPELVGPFTPSSRVLRELGLPEDCTVTVFRMTATKEG